MVSLIDLSNLAKRGDEQAMEDLGALQESIRKRIGKFDEFYSRNYNNEKVSFFEKQKIRLRRLLHEARENEKYSESGGDVKELNMVVLSEADERAYTTKRNDKTGAEASKKDVTKMYSTAKGKTGRKQGTKRNIGTSNMNVTGVSKKKVGVKSKRGY